MCNSNSSVMKDSPTVFVPPADMSKDRRTIRNIVPRNETCYMIFDNERDLEMFLLRYSDRFNAKYFGNSMSKAWQDSRKI